MEFTLSDQMKCLFSAYLCGILLGLIYDFFRCIRVVFKQGKAAVFICDVIFMLCFSFASVFFSMAYSFGKARLFSFFSQICGILSVRFTAGLISIRIFEGLYAKISEKIKKILIKSKKISKKLLQPKGKMLYNKFRKKANVKTDNTL